MSRAGQAGEVGSVFRCAVATHLAVHGLRSRSVSGLALPKGLDLVRLDFETSDATDDVRVTFADGTRAYVSAKRKVTKGRPLEETVAGWIRQADMLGPRDLLVIAGEEFTGPAKHLDHVLRRYRAGLPMETRSEQDAFKVLDDLLPPATRQIVLDHARVLHLPSSTGAAASRDLLAALMDLAVEDRQGQRAVSVLADLFHLQAGEALGSGIDEWVEALINAGVTVIADRGGPAGMRAAYRMIALATYLARLRAQAGRLDLTLLADDLTPIIIDDLIDGLQIDVEGSQTSVDLHRYLRRWRRMLIVGQPGSGKSLAMREIAAHCATHPHAPIPIPVSLPRLMKAKPERLTVDGIIDVAVADLVGADQRGPLAEYLVEALGEGRAIVLCDGLDECGQHAPWVSQQLSEILSALHSRAGFVLTTRANGQIAAARLGLRRVELASPDDLNMTVEHVLVACAETRVPESDRQAWLATRRAWITGAKEQHPDLLRVPLLAVLLTLICADASDADLPRGRATLLHRAVEQSVQRWERRREALDPVRPWSPALTTAMLLRGFIVLGRILDGGVTPSRSEALEALGEMLRDPGQWAMAPALAEEAAEDVLRFWDEHVAVFVVNAADELTTRSKVFAEIATAMWASTRQQQEVTRWLDDALAYTDSDGAIALAAGLDPRTIDALLEVGAGGRPEATLMAVELATRGIVTLQASEMERILRQLIAGSAASYNGVPASRGTRNPPAFLPTLWDEARDPGPWPFVEAACLLPLPDEQRAQRTYLIAQAALDERSETIAAALCALTDAMTDGQALDKAGASAVNVALTLPLPPAAEVIHESRRRVAFVGGGRLAAGLPRVALGAAGRLGELADDAGERVLQIAMHATHGTADSIFAALTRAGVDTSRRWGNLAVGMRSWAAAHKEHELALLADLCSLSESESSIDDDLWSLTDVGDLLAASGYLRVGIGDFAQAFTDDSEKLRRAWLDAVADAYAVHKSAVANQARFLLQAEGKARHNTLNDDWFVASAEPVAKPSLRPDLETTLTMEQHQTLLTCLEAHSDWIARSAATIAANLDAPSWDSEQLFDKDMSRRTLWRAGLLYLVAILSARDERTLLARAAASDSPDYRYAAGLTISVAPNLDPDGLIKRALCQDPDLSVRPKAARDLSPAPTRWTCSRCRQVNDVGAEDCSTCDEGTRPDL